MGVSHDLETFFADFETLLKDPTNGLNNWITQVNTEKSDPIVLKTIDNNAYLFNQLNDEVANFDPFVLYWIVSPGTLGTFGAHANNLEFALSILLVDSNQDIHIQKRVLRYQKALGYFINKNFRNILYASRFEMKDEAPYVLQLEGRTEFHRVAGVTIQTSIAQ